MGLKMVFPNALANSINEAILRKDIILSATNLFFSLNRKLVCSKDQTT